MTDRTNDETLDRLLEDDAKRAAGELDAVAFEARVLAALPSAAEPSTSMGFHHVERDVLGAGRAASTRASNAASSTGRVSRRASSRSSRSSMSSSGRSVMAASPSRRGAP